MQHFDAIVVGIGAMGSATLYQLAKRKIRVCGIEQFQPGHDHGSSHGDSRMIREAYFEHPNYVPLVRRAFKLWHEIGAESGQRLLETPGVLMFGSETSAVIQGMRRSAQLYNIPLDQLKKSDCQYRFPGFEVTDSMQILFEPGAGFIHVEAAVRQMTKLAQRHGAELLPDERVTGWKAVPEGIEVTTNRRQLFADRLVITGGPWIGSLLESLCLPLRLYKMMMLWFKPQCTLPAHMPGFAYDLPDAFYYGLPMVSAHGIKVGKHLAEEELVSASGYDRQLSERHLKPIQSFVRDKLSFLSDQVTHHASCIYTMTPDQDFIIDQHPNDKRVAFASSCSGHGFKFAPVVGEILADLCLDGSTKLPADFLRLNTRFSQLKT